MYPNIGSVTTQPSAPPPPPSSTLANSAAQKPVGFSSLMAQPSNQGTPYPGGQSSQTPYPTGPPSSTPYNNPYSTNNQPPNSSNYSSYSLPNTGQQPPPSQQGGSGYQQTPYPPQSNPYPPQSNPYPPQSNPYPPQSNPYPPQSNPYPGPNPSSGYPGNQQPPPPSQSGYQNPYSSSNPYQSQQGNPGNQNPYRPANPYPPQQGNIGNQNPYQSQQGGYPPQQPYNPQQQSYQSPYAPNSQDFHNNNAVSNSVIGGYGGYPPYNQPQQPYQNSYNAYQPPGGGFNANSYGPPAANNDRLRAITGRYEINDQLAQRLNILQQFEIVVLCDDSGSMNTPVDGTNGTRWDELRSIVQIIIEIGCVFDSNGVDVHFLNRPPMRNVTDPRQVVESFSQRPGGLTPLTQALRTIFHSAASKPGSDKRLLVFVATDGAPTDPNGNVDIQSLENLMRNERQANTTYVTFLACTDDDSSVAYLSQWDRTMLNVDVVDDYKTEREEVRRNRGHNYPFSFGDYVAKALLGAVDPQMDQLDEGGYNNNNNNFRRFN